MVDRNIQDEGMSMETEIVDSRGGGRAKTSP
jgi:hypothetical protein